MTRAKCHWSAAHERGPLEAICPEMKRAIEQGGVAPLILSAGAPQSHHHVPEGLEPTVGCTRGTYASSNGTSRVG